MMIEASNELVRVIDSYKQQIEDAEDHLARLRGEQRRLIDDEARRLAKFQIGQRVRTDRHQYEITRIDGFFFNLTAISGIKPQLRIEYSGRQVLRNGTLGAREKQIFDFQAVEGAQADQKASEAVSRAENGSSQP